MSSLFLPTASLEHLQARARLLGRVRAFFDSREFWEVETPLLSADTVIDRYLEPIPVDNPCPSATGGHRTAWLQTSPEFGMKRLLAAGASSIYQVTRAFRRDESGPLHNPEFTLVEWYRVGDDPQAGVDLLAEFIQTLLPADHVVRRTYREVFEERLGLNPHRASCEQLRAAAEAHRLAIPASFGEADRDSWLDLLLSEIIQPQLGQTQPLILSDYPASQAALARIRHDEDPVAERFELFVHGIELANGYHELQDAEELAARQQEANRQRVAAGRRALPEHNRLLAAMRHGLPPCSGVALGFDRLAMVVLRAASLRDVLAFPFERA